MTSENVPRPSLSPKERRIVRARWEWAGQYAMFSIVMCVLIMGGAFAIFDDLGAEEKARTPSLILLATLILINVFWRAVGALAGRIELIFRVKSGNGHR
jgi:hypothetical protein